MDREKYLSMEDEDELYKNLVNDIQVYINEASDLIEYLASSERYNEDYVFRTFVETGRVMMFSRKGQHEQVISVANEILVRAKALKIWMLVSFHQNILGVSYHILGMFERALEHYKQAIRTEETHGLSLIAATAYNNIALIYLSLDDADADIEAYKYFNLSIKALEKGSLENNIYRSKLVYSLSNLISLLCVTNRLDEALPIFKRIEENLKYDIVGDSMYSYYRAIMLFSLYSGEYEKGKSAYIKAREFIAEENTLERMSLLENFTTTCQTCGLDYDFYIEELLKAEAMKKTEATIVNVNVYSSLRKYYKEIGNKEKLEDITEKYLTVLAENAASHRRRQFSSLKMVDSIIEGSGDAEEIEIRNKELKLLADEAMRHKNALTEAYQRIELINELGKKVTSSLNLEAVVDFIHKNLSTYLPLNTFALVLVNPQKSMLSSVACYENGSLKNEINIPLSNKKSLFVSCYDSGELIVSSDIFEDERFKPGFPIFGETLTHSAIFMPLHVENEIIGVCTVQDTQIDAYNEKHIAFLKEIIPYLSIALNNAQHSWALEQEIQTRLVAQAELEALNKKLSLLSSLDGLTQISNRRDFEAKLLDLLGASAAENKEVSIYMFDVDNFKAFNDTYGHLEGDEALKQIALIIQSNMSEVDGLAARFGGEEFVAATSGLDAESSRRLAEKICDEVYNLGIVHEKSPFGRLSISIGLANLKRAGISQKSLLMKKADDALYDAKTAGKNKVVLIELNLMKS